MDGSGEFNSDDHCIYCCGHESHRRNEVTIIINKRVQNAVQPQKWQNDLSSFPRQTIQYHSNNPSLCLYNRCWRSWSWPVLWRPIIPPRTNIKKRSPSHHRGLECKSRKSRGTWCNRQVWPWRTKWNRAKTNWILPRECIGHSKYPFSTTQEMTLHMDEHHQITNTEIKCIHIRQYIKTIGWLRVIRVEIGQERRWIL